MPGMEHVISKTVLLAIVLAPLLGAIIAGLFRRQVGRAGAHWVVDSVADLLPCLDAIDRRLAAGERP